MQAEEVDAETVQTVEVDAETVADTIAEELVLPPVAEVESDDGLCPDYASLEGCPKKDACELKHPTAPNGDVTMRVCTYYLSKSGCQKKARCNFLHHYGKSPVESRPPGETRKICSFFFREDGGCVKQDRCDFWHPTAPNGVSTTRLCNYFFEPRGCAKDARCDFLHVPRELLPIEAFQSPKNRGLDPMSRGGAPGGGFQGMGMGGGMGGMGGGMGGMVMPPSGSPMGRMGGSSGGADLIAKPAMPTTASETGNTRVCQYYGAARGCIKGDRCDFVHAACTGGPAARPPTQGYAPPPAHGYGGYSGGYPGGQAPVDPGNPWAAWYAAYGGGYGQEQPAPNYGQQHMHAQAPYGQMPDPRMSGGMMGGGGMGGGMGGGIGGGGGMGGGGNAGGGMGGGMGGGGGGEQRRSTAPGGGGGGTGRACTFFNSPRGCIKGDRCDFTHATGAAPSNKPSVRYSPY